MITLTTGQLLFYVVVLLVILHLLGIIDVQPGINKLRSLTSSAASSAGDAVTDKAGV
jgi:hypothetical protein